MQGGGAGVRMDRPGLGHNTVEPPYFTAETWATTRRGKAMILPGGRACVRYGAQCARLGAGSRYNNCIVAERGATLCRDTVQPEAAILRSTPCDTMQGRCDTRGSVRHDARA